CGRRVAGARGVGLEAGDRIGVVGPNWHRSLECYQATPGAGMAIVPLNARHTAPELRYALEDSGARVVFSGVGDRGLSDVVEHVIDLGDGYEALLAGAEPADFDDGGTGGEDSLAGLFYTGGTTGASKGVMLSHRNLIANAVNTLNLLGLTPEDRWLIMAPMFHAAGTVAVLANIWLGATQIITPFDPAAALDLVEAEAVTAMLGVPTMVAAVAEEQLA